MWIVRCVVLLIVRLDVVPAIITIIIRWSVLLLCGSSVFAVLCILLEFSRLSIVVP